MSAPLDGTSILITGASSGIGEALARQLAPRAAALGLLARRRERLEALATQLRAENPRLKAVVLPCDLRDLGAVAAAVDRFEAEAGPVEVLFNNAGLGHFGCYDLSSWETTKTLIDTNVVAVAWLTRRVLPGMVARGRGGILMVSSGFGIDLLPGFSTYCGAKHFVTAMTECLRWELLGTGVVVSQVCPGPVDTEFEEIARGGDFPRVPGVVKVSAEHVAALSIRLLERERAFAVPGLHMKALLGFSYYVPRVVKRVFFDLFARRVRRMVVRVRGGPAPG
jgi:hypothetical protein